MQLYTHKDYSFYVGVQQKLTSIKTMQGKLKDISWINEDGIHKVNSKIHEYIPTIHTMVCHGCRCGYEMEIFRKLNPDAIVFGTDVYKKAYAYNREYFRNIDFDVVPGEWIGYFDVVYSNSIDHSRDPLFTLNSWKLELKEGGVSYITFYWGTGVSRTDCFQLDSQRWREEIDDICDRAGMKILSISDDYVDKYLNHCADVVIRK